MDLKLNPDRDISIDINNIDSELRLYSPLFHRYLERKVRAEYNYELAREKHKDVSARISYEKKLSEVKITEKTLANYVQTHEDVQEAKQEELMAKLKYEKIKAFCEAFRAKKDALVNLSANQRIERG